VDNIKRVILADPDIMEPPDGEFFFYDEQFPKDRKDVYEEGDKKGRPIPNYSINEVAKFFFGRNAQWMRWRYSSDARVSPITGKPNVPKHPDGYFVLDGKPLLPKVSPSGQRYYTLADVERMAHALAQNRVISGLELQDVLRLLQLTYKIWQRGRS
jgi:hypothetical protein